MEIGLRGCGNRDCGGVEIGVAGECRLGRLGCGDDFGGGGEICGENVWWCGKNVVTLRYESEMGSERGTSGEKLALGGFSEMFGE